MIDATRSCKRSKRGAVNGRFGWPSAKRPAAGKVETPPRPQGDWRLRHSGGPFTTRHEIHHGSRRLFESTCLAIGLFAVLLSPLRAQAPPPNAVCILPLFETISQVGTAKFTEADLQAEMTKLKAQIGQNHGDIRVGFAHIMGSEQSLRVQCRMSKANNLSAGVIIAVQTHSGSFGFPKLVAQDFRRMQWRLDGKTWEGKQVTDKNGSVEFPARDWQVPTPSRYCTAIHDAAMSEVLTKAKQIHAVMLDYPGVIVVVNAAIEEELATGGEKSDDQLADYSPYAITEFRDWLRHTGIYDDVSGKYAGQGAPPEIVGPFVRINGVPRSQFYDDSSPATNNGSGKSFDQRFGTNFTTWTLRNWDLKKFPAPITDPDFDPTPSSGAGLIAGGFDAPRKRDIADKFWNAWSWDVPDHSGLYPPGNPKRPAFGFRQFEVEHFVSDVLDTVRSAGIPSSMIYAHQIPAEQVSPGRCRSGADPIWTGYYAPSGTLGITRFGPIDVSKLTQYSHDWGIFEWHPMPNAKPDDPALYDSAMRAITSYTKNGGRMFFPGWWRAGGKIESIFPLNDSQFAAALHDWIAKRK